MIVPAKSQYISSCSQRKTSLWHWLSSETAVRSHLSDRGHVRVLGDRFQPTSLPVLLSGSPFSNPSSLQTTLHSANHVKIPLVVLLMLQVVSRQLIPVVIQIFIRVLYRAARLMFFLAAILRVCQVKYQVDIHLWVHLRVLVVNQVSVPVEFPRLVTQRAIQVVTHLDAISLSLYNSNR